MISHLGVPSRLPVDGKAGHIPDAVDTSVKAARFQDVPDGRSHPIVHTPSEYQRGNSASDVVTSRTGNTGIPQLNGCSLCGTFSLEISSNANLTCWTSV